MRAGLVGLAAALVVAPSAMASEPPPPEQAERSCGMVTARGYYHTVLEVVVMKGDVPCAEAKRLAVRAWGEQVFDANAWTCYVPFEEIAWDMTCGYRTNPQIQNPPELQARAAGTRPLDDGTVIERSERAFVIYQVRQYPSARARRDAARERRRRARMRRAPYRYCGHGQSEPGAGVFHVRAKNLSCGRARRIARRYFFRYCGEDPCYYEGFRCRTTRSFYEGGRAICVRDLRVIRFEYGA